jgi:ribulose-5-phosphate 4-epimerase/fuculose-1-phosphate aldolase
MLEDRELVSRLVLACRAVALRGHGDLIYGHVSVRVPGADDRILMKGHGIGLDEVGPEDILLLDLDGNRLEGRRRSHHEWPIHTEILRARPDAAAVVHTHPLYSVALGASEHDLEPITHHGCHFVPPRVPKFNDTTDLITTPTLGRALARALGSHKAVLLRNHGSAVVGRTVEEAAVAAVLLEQACMEQLTTQQFGPHQICPDDEAVSRRDFVYPRYTGAVWDYLVRQVCARWLECRSLAGARADKPEGELHSDSEPYGVA